MKIWKKLFLLALIGCAGNLQAQTLVSKKKAAIPLPFGQQPLKLRQASDLIVKATIPQIKKPFVVALDLAAQMQQVKDQCPLLQNQEPGLELDGERSTNSSVRLEWETTNGWNNEFFRIERSLGDTFHFATVGSVWAKQVAGFKDLYRQPDENDYKQISYYRIRLQLRDGDVRYSNIAAVKGYEIDDVRLFPNPGAGKVTITLYSDQAGDAVIKTYDAAGKLAIQQTEALQAGFNTRELNVARLAGGLYTVKVAMPDKQEKTTRLVRQ